MSEQYCTAWKKKTSRKIPSLVQRTRQRTSLAHKPCTQALHTKLRTKQNTQLHKAQSTRAHKPAHKAKRTSPRTKRTRVRTQDCLDTIQYHHWKKFEPDYSKTMIGGPIFLQGGSVFL